MRGWRSVAKNPVFVSAILQDEKFAEKVEKDNDIATIKPKPMKTSKIKPILSQLVL